MDEQLRRRSVGLLVMRRAFVCLVVLSCKKPPTPLVAIIDGAPAASSVAMHDAGPPAKTYVPRAPERFRASSVDAIAVSSRVDNATESPDALVDGDTDTAWSSKTGDLVGAWVALRLLRADKLAAVELTVGMTKSEELFTQNVRIAEVRVSLAETTLVDHFKLDTESRGLQKIPVSVSGPGVLKITVQAIKAGTKASWRETTISEIKLDDADGALAIVANTIDVGGFDPKPRGVLGLVPERPPNVGCLAVVASVPKAFCILGTKGSTGNAIALMTVDKNGSDTLEALVPPTAGNFPRLPYDGWMRAEVAARGATKLDKSSSTDIPWNGSVEIEGATFRQRETSHLTGGEGPDMFNGVLEARFPSTTSFETIFDDTSTAGTSPMLATLWRVGAMWLVERDMNHGSEGWYIDAAGAVMCDLKAKHCGTFTMPASIDPAQ
jgi:hypothetical protein